MTRCAGVGGGHPQFLHELVESRRFASNARIPMVAPIVARVRAWWPVEMWHACESILGDWDGKTRRACGVHAPLLFEPHYANAAL